MIKNKKTTGNHKKIGILRTDYLNKMERPMASMTGSSIMRTLLQKQHSNLSINNSLAVIQNYELNTFGNIPEAIDEVKKYCDFHHHYKGIVAY